MHTKVASPATSASHATRFMHRLSSGAQIGSMRRMVGYCACIAYLWLHVSFDVFENDLNNDTNTVGGRREEDQTSRPGQISDKSDCLIAK